MAEAEWDLAGFTNLDGSLDKKVQTKDLWIPGRICLEEGHIVWELITSDEKPRARQPPNLIFNSFAGLWNASDTAILHFAKRYGVLYLDEQGQPGGHVGASGREPLALWRKISRRAVAVMNIAAVQQQSGLGEAKDWQLIRPDIDPQFPRINPWMPWGLEAARQFLGMELAFWQARARISLGVRWDSVSTKHGEWRMAVDLHGSVFAAVTLQLLLTIAKAEGLYICSGCQLPYLRVGKRPKSGQRNFCANCGRSEAVRQADKERKARMAEAKRLHIDEGWSISEVAKKLGSKPASVKRWVKSTGGSSGKTSRAK